MRVYSAFSVVRFVATAMALLAVSTGSVLAEDLGSLLSDNTKGVSQDILAGQRGGTDEHPNAVVTHNVAISGDNNSVNTVANSMNGASGLFNVMQNNGNNVAMQSQITVNANIH
jgi:hypothetical protein